MFKRRSYLPFVVLAVMTAGACAPAATTGEKRRQNVITQDELQSIRVSNLYEAVSRLRPRWLEVRSMQTLGGSGATAILVYQNRSRLGGAGILRELDPGVAVWLEFLDGPTASASLPGIGAQDVEGAIIIHTTPPGS